MLPGIGGMDARSMSRMMAQMGIKNEEIPAKRVVIEQDGSQLIIENPQVTKITMQGQSSFQISGQITQKSSLSPDDVKMVAQNAGVDEASARAALEESHGDIAEAIMKLKGGG